MLVPFLQKTAQGLRNFIPVLSCLLFIFLGTFVWPLPYLGTVTPMLGLVAVYYWAIYRPDLLRPLAVFILGLLNDILNFYPPGLSSFIYVGVYQLSYSQRRLFVGQIFSMLWAGFALVAFLASFVQWSFLSLVNDRALAILPVFIQFLLTATLLPLPAWLLNKLQRIFLSNG